MGLNLRPQGADGRSELWTLQLVTTKKGGK